MKAALRRHLPQPLRRVAARIVYPLLVTWDVVRHRGDRLVPPAALISVGDGDFEAVGRQFLRYFREYAGLRPDENVLEVGCGSGRMAIPLTQYLSSSGSYDGFDVVSHGVAWCRHRISPRFPNFRFRHVPVRNRQYNPRGRMTVADFRFPYPSASFNLVILTSVFTHMMPDEIDHYLSEVARVLRVGGRCFSTWFLLNNESLTLIEKGLSTLPFRYPVDGCLTTDAEIPEQAIAIDEKRVRAIHGSHSLLLDAPIRYGWWCGRAEFVSYQDLCLAHKAGTR